MLVPENIVKAWYKDTSPIYQAFAFLFQNPLWRAKIPSGFSVCPYFWLALFSMVLARPLIYLIALVIVPLSKLVFLKPVAAYDSFVRKHILQSNAARAGMGVGISVASVIIGLQLYILISNLWAAPIEYTVEAKYLLVSQVLVCYSLYALFRIPASIFCIVKAKLDLSDKLFKTTLLVSAAALGIVAYQDPLLLWQGVATIFTTIWELIAGACGGIWHFLGVIGQWLWADVIVPFWNGCIALVAEYGLGVLAIVTGSLLAGAGTWIAASLFQLKQLENITPEEINRREWTKVFYKVYGAQDERSSTRQEIKDILYKSEIFGLGKNYLNRLARLVNNHIMQKRLTALMPQLEKSDNWADEYLQDGFIQSAACSCLHEALNNSNIRFNNMRSTTEDVETAIKDLGLREEAQEVFDRRQGIINSWERAGKELVRGLIPIWKAVVYPFKKIAAGAKALWNYGKILIIAKKQKACPYLQFEITAK